MNHHLSSFICWPAAPVDVDLPSQANAAGKKQNADADDTAYEAVKEVQQLRLDQKARIDEQRRNRDELERLNALIEELRRDKEEAELRHREEMAAGGGLSAFP